MTARAGAFLLLAAALLASAGHAGRAADDLTGVDQLRALYSAEFRFTQVQAQYAGGATHVAEPATITTDEYHGLADEYLDALVLKLEEMGEETAQREGYAVLRL